MATSIRKPKLEEALDFAEEQKPAKKPKNKTSKSGQIPDGDMRLVANIDIDLHTRLKTHASRNRTTIRAVLEQWIKENTKKL